MEKKEEKGRWAMNQVREMEKMRKMQVDNGKNEYIQYGLSKPWKIFFVYM